MNGFAVDRIEYYRVEMVFAMRLAEDGCPEPEIPLDCPAFPFCNLLEQACDVFMQCVHIGFPEWRSGLTYRLDSLLIRRMEPVTPDQRDIDIPMGEFVQAQGFAFHLIIPVQFIKPLVDGLHQILIYVRIDVVWKESPFPAGRESADPGGEDVFVHRTFVQTRDGVLVGLKRMIELVIRLFPDVPVRIEHGWEGVR